MTMFGKGTKLYSIFKNRCPRCQNGLVFKAKNAYDFKSMTQMYERCTSCELKYEMEPAFWYGSMYAAYGLAVALSVSLFVATEVLLNLSLTEYLILNGVALVLLIPPIWRLSRLIWINLFVSYKSEFDERR